MYTSDLVPNIIYGSNIVGDTIHRTLVSKSKQWSSTTGPISVTIDRNRTELFTAIMMQQELHNFVYDAQQNPTTHTIIALNWTVTYSSYSITMETNQVIPAFGSSRVEFTIRQNPNNFNNDIVTVRIALFPVEKM